MKNQNLDFKKIVKQIESIHSIAKQNNWIPYYDRELDEFYLSPSKIDKSFSLHAIGKEFLVYVDKNSNIGGIFMEYFAKNLATHDEKFKPFKAIVVRKEKFNKNEKTLLLNTLEAALLEAVTPKMLSS